MHGVDAETMHRALWRQYHHPTLSGWLSDRFGQRDVGDALYAQDVRDTLIKYALTADECDRLMQDWKAKRASNWE